MTKIVKNLLILTILLGTNLFASKDTIKIDIVSDVVCPWCAIGYKRLSVAIDELNLKDKVKISWHPFQLNPDMPREGTNADKYLMNKYGLSEDRLKKTRNNVTELGKETGFKFDYFSNMKKLNTFNAHILLDYAKDFNKQTQLKVRLQKAYFGERKDISSRNVLVKELDAVGLNVADAMARLDDPKAIEHVKSEEKYWRDRGVYAIPTMLFDNSEVRVGASSIEEYKKLLLQLTQK